MRTNKNLNIVKESSFTHYEIRLIPFQITTHIRGIESNWILVIEQENKVQYINYNKI